MTGGPKSLQLKQREPPAAAGSERLHANPGKTVVLFGDSLSTGFNVQSLPSSILAARALRSFGWFNAANFRSLSDDLTGPCDWSFTQYATVSAHAISPAKPNFSHTLLGTRHLRDQISQALRGRAPDIALLWIGHNDLDYVSLGRNDIAEYGQEIATAVLEQVTLLRTPANDSVQPRLVIVFGLVDFESFFCARDEVETVKRGSRGSYPYFENCYRIFPSMLRPHRRGMIDLALRVNESVALGITQLGRDAPTATRLVYSEALHRTDISRAICLSDFDGWHPSPFGHSLFAKSAVRAVREHWRPR